jgi:hypothetical protein
MAVNKAERYKVAPAIEAEARLVTAAENAERIVVAKVFGAVASGEGRCGYRRRSRATACQGVSRDCREARARPVGRDQPCS